MGSGSARVPNFGCVRGTKPSFFTFARENSGVQPLAMAVVMAVPTWRGQWQRGQPMWAEVIFGT